MAIDGLRYATSNYATQSDVAAAGGLVLVSVTAFTTASSVSVNNCFSSLYENYQIIFDGYGSTALALNLRMRSSGTDATASNYNWQELNAGGTSVTGTLSTSIPQHYFGRTDTGRNVAQQLVSGPFAAEETRFQSFSNYANGASVGVQIHFGNHAIATSYDGFTLIASSGTFTGTIRVYGYRNSI